MAPTSTSTKPKKSDGGKSAKVAEGAKPSPAGAGMIKSAGAKVSNKEDAVSSSSRKKSSGVESKEGGAASAKDVKSTKGILKKKSGGRTKDNSKKGSEKKVKAKVKKKSAYEKMAASFGFYVGKVTLVDPMAIEAVQALDLGQSQLRTLRAKFDKIDIDGSGAIDYDEFFEAVEENRSPFTDKLFALIGKSFTIVVVMLGE